MSTDTAHDYARRICDELRIIDHVYEQWTREDPEQWDSEARRWADDIGYDPDDNPDVSDIGMRWLEDQLDVWAVIEWRHGNSTVSEVRALRTCNGPHCEVVYRGDETLTVHVWWGGEECTRQVECPPVADAMAIVWDNAEEMTRS